MKNFLLSNLSKLINFCNNKLSIKIETKSPAQIHLDAVSKDCYEFFKEELKQSFVFNSDESIRAFAINEAIKKNNNDQLFLEFGVFKGSSINLFAKLLTKIKSKIYGFDSFEGLKDEWITSEFNPVGTFNNNKKKPKVLSNVFLIDGWVENTLDNFLEENNEKKISFVHFDMDTYKSTLFVLNKIKKLLIPGSIILFDEFYGFPNWEKYEYRALIETLEKNKYKYIAFANRQACIEII